MKFYVVTFELKDLGAPDSRPLIEEMRRTPTGHCEATRNSWLIATEESARALFDRLAAHIRPFDALFVAQIDHVNNWARAPGHVLDWIRNAYRLATEDPAADSP